MRWKPIVQKIILVALGIIFTLIILEIGLRLYLTYFGREDQRVLYLYNREQLEQLASRHRGLPYINYGLNPDHPDNNKLGYRGQEIQVPKSEDTFRIVALGGSTTYGEGLAADKSYPSQLEFILNNEYGFGNIEVVNSGVVHYSSWESLANVVYRIDDIQPNMIIVYHAINDIYPRLVHPDQYSGINYHRGLWLPELRPVPISALYRFIALRLGQPVRYDDFDTHFMRVPGTITCGGFHERDGEFYCNNFDMLITEVLEKNPPTYFERNMRTIQLVAQSRGIDVVFVGFAYSPLPYPDDLGGKFMTFSFNQQAIADHNQITENVANELGIPFYNLPDDMPQDAEYWRDGVHVNEPGARLQAEFLATFLVENNLIPRQ